MPKTHPTVENKKITFQTAECKLTLASNVIEHGKNLYIKLPRSQADYYGIGSGDTVLISILEVRRAKQDE